MTLEEVACAKKVRYMNKKEAKRSARIVAAQHGIRGLKPYACEFCGQIHLGHKPGKATYRRYDAVNDPGRP